MPNSHEKHGSVSNGAGAINDNSSKPSLLDRLKRKSETREPEVMSVEAWLERCRTDSGAYAPHYERLAEAYGTAEIIDTKHGSPQENNVYGGKKIKRFPAFAHLYDKEDMLSKLVDHIKDGASGLAVLRGPVGSGKSDIATTSEKAIEKKPFYLLRCKKNPHIISPFNDSPLCLFSADSDRAEFSKEYGIPERLMDHVPSPWVTKRLDFWKGDIEKAFEVVKVYPSRDRQLGVAKLSAEDKKAPDIGSLIGRVDMTKIGQECPLDPNKTMSAGDPDAYIPGALSKSHGGFLHLSEYFRNNEALLNVFLDAVVDGYFVGGEGIGTLPCKQVIMITTNDPVFQEMLNKKDSDAIHNRSISFDVPYTLRLSEEKKIYEKLAKKHGLDKHAMAPGTLDLMAEFAVASRMKDGVKGALAVYDKHIRARVLNGEKVDGAEGKVPSPDELRNKRSKDEGQDGFTIRDAERLMKACFNKRSSEGIVEADTLLMVETLREFLNNADEKQVPSDKKDAWIGVLDSIKARNITKIKNIVNTALVDADDGNCQVQFDKYVMYAQAFLDEETLSSGGEVIKLDAIKKHLEQMEKRAGITQPVEFRRGVVEGINRELARIGRLNQGKPPEEQEPVMVKWRTYEKLAKVIEKQNEMDLESRRHIIKAKSESDLKTEEERRQYGRFYHNMHEQGYTDTMVNRMLMEML